MRDDAQKVVLVLVYACCRCLKVLRLGCARQACWSCSRGGASTCTGCSRLLLNRCCYSLRRFRGVHQQPCLLWLAIQTLTYYYLFSHLHTSTSGAKPTPAATPPPLGRTTFKIASVPTNGNGSQQQPHQPPAIKVGPTLVPVAQHTREWQLCGMLAYGQGCSLTRCWLPPPLVSPTHLTALHQQQESAAAALSSAVNIHQRLQVRVGMCCGSKGFAACLTHCVSLTV